MKKNNELRSGALTREMLLKNIESLREYPNLYKIYKGMIDKDFG